MRGVRRAGELPTILATSGCRLNQLASHPARRRRRKRKREREREQELPVEPGHGHPLCQLTSNKGGKGQFRIRLQTSKLKILLIHAAYAQVTEVKKKMTKLLVVTIIKCIDYGD